MSDRARELMEAASVLAETGDRLGALRLAEEALRLAPDDAEARSLRDALQASATTPFAPPPSDLFEDLAPPGSANPFVRPPTAGPPSPASPPTRESELPSGARALGELLHGAMATLGEPEASELPPSRSPQPTDPFARNADPSPASTLLFAQGAAPTSGATLPFASSPSKAAPPSGSTLPFAQGASAPSESDDLFDAPISFEGFEDAALPPPTGSTPTAARSATLLAGTPSAAQPSRAPETATLEAMLAGALADAPVPAPPSSPRPATGAARPSSQRPRSDGKARTARPKSKVPNDPMDLLDEPPTPGTVTSIEAMVRRARELLEFADHSGALELLEQALAQAPMNAEALALKARCETTLISMFESKLGDLQRRPRLRLRPDEVIWLNLDHRAGFVLAQIDGQVSLEDLFDLSGMSRFDTARILAQLVEEKVIQL